MVVIWGLDLKEMKWSKFNSSYMWGNTYHMRRRKFGVYQLAMILCVVSESLGTEVLSKYIDQQDAFQRSSSTAGHHATIYNNDVVGSFSYNIFVGVYIATIFGAAFFFDLFWPERHESTAVKIAWRICSVLACIFALSSALALTVILSTHRAVVVGVQGREVLQPPLVYRKNGKAIAGLVLIWLGWLATMWATYLMWSSISYIDRYGPFSKHVLNGKVTKDAQAGDIEAGQSDELPGNNVDVGRQSATEEEEKEALDGASTAPNTEAGDVDEPPVIPTPALPTPSIDLNKPPLFSRETQER